MWEIWVNLLLPKALKSCPKYKNRQIWSQCSLSLVHTHLLSLTYSHSPTVPLSDPFSYTSSFSLSLSLSLSLSISCSHKLTMPHSISAILTLYLTVPLSYPFMYTYYLILFISLPCTHFLSNQHFLYPPFTRTQTPCSFSLSLSHVFCCMR